MNLAPELAQSLVKQEALAKHIGRGIVIQAAWLGRAMQSYEMGAFILQEAPDPHSESQHQAALYGSRLIGQVFPEVRRLDNLRELAGSCDCLEELEQLSVCLPWVW